MQPIRVVTLAAAALLALGLAPPSRAHESEEEADVGEREAAGKRISWSDHASEGQDADRGERRRIHVKLLGINDFHGHLAFGARVAGKPTGGAAVLATYLKEAQRGMEENTILVHAGDHVGASPAESSLLADEPSISFLNLLANENCNYEERFDPDCNIVGTAGNHEFDQGYHELQRLIGGGNSPKGPFLEDPWRGARYPMVLSNVVETSTGRTLLPPSVIKEVDGVSIGFIGAVLRGTPSIVSAAGIQGLSFLDEATEINRAVRALKREGVRAIVVTIHQGGRSASYTGPTLVGPGAPAETGDILDIVRHLDDEVDVVISGHTHSFTNAIVANQNGAPILVTQAFSYGTAFADIDLTIDRASKDVVAKSAAIVTTWQTRADGTPVPRDPATDALVQQAVARVAPLVNRVVGRASVDITRDQTPAGESALGDLIADAQRAEMAADFAFMNPGGIRADLTAGDVTWGQLFTVQPFGNSLVKMQLSGAQIATLLEQQWTGQTTPRFLQVSGLTYTWDATLPVGSRVVAIRKSGLLLDPSATYAVVVNSFLADGGDNFTVLKSGTARVGGPLDLDALIHYIQLKSPLQVGTDGRVARLH